MKYPVLSFAAGALLAALSGCATYTETTGQAAAARRSGNTQAAALAAEQLAQKHQGDRDAIIYELEAAAAYRTLALNQVAPPPPPPAPAAPAPTVGPAAGADPLAPAAHGSGAAAEDWRWAPYKKSLQFLARADDRIDEFDEKAKHSVSAGATLMVTNPQMVPYRGQPYDKVMASTYAALDYLALGEREKARASFNKAYLRQADAVAENEKRIELAQQKIAAARDGKLVDDAGKRTSNGIDVSKSQGDAKTKAALDDINRSLDRRMQAYGDYVNPFTVFADALFMTACSTDPQERERGAKQFLRAAAMVPENEYLRQDAAQAEELAAGRGTLAKTTYVIFESGEAAHREEMLVPVPIFLAQKPGQPPLYTQLPLYRLAFNDRFNPAATVTSGARQLTTALVCDMDSVIARDYKNNLGTMWLDAFLCASTKALINYEVGQEAKKQGSNAGLIFGAIMGVVNAATTRADTRSWSSLPKTFSYARLATPADGTLTISTPDGVAKTVTVPTDATVAVVYVKQIQPGQPLLVDTFKLL